MGSSPIRRSYCARSRGVKASRRCIDTRADAVLEPRQRAAIPPFGGSSRVERHRQFSLLVVRADGGRVFGLTFPLRLSLVIAAGVIVVASALGLLACDWW